MYFPDFGICFVLHIKTKGVFPNAFPRLHLYFLFRGVGLKRTCWFLYLMPLLSQNTLVLEAAVIQAAGP